VYVSIVDLLTMSQTEQLRNQSLIPGGSKEICILSKGIQNNYSANCSWTSEALFVEAKQPGHTKQAMYT